jgi:hypothetical protein
LKSLKALKTGLFFIEKAYGVSKEYRPNPIVQMIYMKHLVSALIIRLSVQAS